MNKLFRAYPDPHVPTNSNDVEQGRGTELALRMVRGMSAFFLFWVVVVCCVLWAFGTTVIWVADLSPYPLFLVLVTLPQLALSILLGLTLSVIGRKQEAALDEAYLGTRKQYHVFEQMEQHMQAQDTKLLELEEKLDLVLTRRKRRAHASI